MHAIFRSVDGGQNFCGKSGCLLAHGGNAFADKPVEVGLQASGCILGDSTTVICHFDFRHAIHHLQTDAVWGGDLEQAGFEGKALGDFTCRRKTLLNGGDQVLGTAVHVPGCFAPFDQSAFTQR